MSHRLGVIRVAASCVLLAMTGNTVADAQCVREQNQTPAALTPKNGDFFGTDVALEGSVLAIGSPLDDVGGIVDAGSVEVRRRVQDEWLFEELLTASDEEEDASFGDSVGLSLPFLLVGAPFDDSVAGNSGAVYVFQDDGTDWVETQKIIVSNASGGDVVGSSLAVRGDVAVAGAWGRGEDGLFSGAAYVFRSNGSTWSEEQMLKASDAARTHFFGGAVAVHDDRIVVGAVGADGVIPQSGAAYVFRYDGSQWQEEQKLFSSDAGNIQQFGMSVAIEDDWILVGADEDDQLADNAGAVYAFRHDGTSWVEEQRIDSSLPSMGHDFGTAVALSGNRAVLTAARDDIYGNDAGLAFLYERTGNQWSEIQRFESSDPVSGARLGWCAALDDDAAFVGAPGDQVGAVENAGSVLIYHQSVQPLALDASPNSVGAGEDLELTTWCGPASTPAFLYSISVGGTPLFLRVAKGSFDGAGRWKLGTIVPAGLQGLSVVLQCLAVDGGTVVTSNPETLAFD